MTIASAIWRHLEAMGHARARRELRQLAARWEFSNPALAEQMRQASLRQPEAGTANTPPSAQPRQAAPALALLQRR